MMDILDAMSAKVTAIENYNIRITAAMNVLVKRLNRLQNISISKTIERKKIMMAVTMIKAPYWL